VVPLDAGRVTPPLGGGQRPALDDTRPRHRTRPSPFRREATDGTGRRRA